MKGLKKFYSLFLVLFTMFGFSFIFSSDTSALKHSYSSFYIPGFYIYLNQSGQPDFILHGAYDTEVSTSHPLSNPVPKSQQLLQSGVPCYQSSYSSLLNQNASSVYLYKTHFFFNVGFNNIDSLSTGLFCHSLNSKSWYDYTSIPITASSSSNSTNATIRDLFGNNSHYMYGFTLPLTFNSEVLGQMSSGRTYHFHGEFGSTEPFYSSDSSGNLASSFTQPYVILQFEGVSTSGSFYSSKYSWDNISSDSISNYCTKLVLSATKKLLSFDCYFTAPADIKYSTFSVRFSSVSQYASNHYSQKPVWYNHSDLVFIENFYVITDNNDSPGGDASISPSGLSISSAPGSSSTYGDSYNDSLSSLFSFNFLNPFVPIFNLFTDNSSCVSIPIIAGMLNSSETTYCPWFSSDVRNILTPVLGISSMMLLFGFLVRWLGSSSGNFFEDSKTEEVSNQGGRWGHFKKGKN